MFEPFHFFHKLKKEVHFVLIYIYIYFSPMADFFPPLLISLFHFFTPREKKVERSVFHKLKIPPRKKNP